ncbi:heat shock protein DnaJ domain protein (plasmid) [Rhodothermus marinus SG0.5JP17-172]|uniref:J domain-containing protein n=1 Tax=Rhodothermus marinus TaxID=29549 RepID=UPI000223D0F9|nr:J domain-containing protein [Rhodothermus marinus]AEN74761.1 heat shock protein DnaJ domain protein [Rhodothermus marinus SG0.5JP17-172]
MEQLERAHDLIEKGKHREAYLLLGECVDRALRELEADRRARRNGFVLGLGVSLLTGGLGLEDLIWGPLAYKVARTFSGGTMKPEEAGQLLIEALNLRIFLLENMPEFMTDVEESSRVLRDILLLYLMLKQKDELFDQLLPQLIGHPDPWLVVRHLSGEIGDKNFYDLDTLLFICLFLYDLRRGELYGKLYRKLRRGRESLEQELERIRRKKSGDFEGLDAALEQHYAAVLELKAPYTAEKVRRNYRRLIKACHPDRMQQASAEERRRAEERARELNEAYEYFRARLNF